MPERQLQESFGDEFCKRLAGDLDGLASALRRDGTAPEKPTLLALAVLCDTFAYEIRLSLEVEP